MDPGIHISLNVLTLLAQDHRKEKALLTLFCCGRIKQVSGHSASLVSAQAATSHSTTQLWLHWALNVCLGAFSFCLPVSVSHNLESFEVYRQLFHRTLLNLDLFLSND